MIQILYVFCLLLFAESMLYAQPASNDLSAMQMNYIIEKSSAVIKYDCTFVDLQADGKYESLKHYRVYIRNERNIKEYAQDVTTYNVEYDTVQVLFSRVYLPSGNVIEVDDSYIKDIPLPAADKFFVQNVRERIINFPELTAGAEVEVAYKVITHDPPMEGQFEYKESFEHTDPILTKYFQITAPEKMEIYWKAKNGTIPYSKSSLNGMATHIWVSNNIPYAVPEPGMPPSPEVERALYVTTVKDWKTWSRWYYGIAEPMMAADNQIKKTVAQLTHKKKTRDEKIREIFNYCSNQIRYVETAFSGRKGGYRPDSAAVTMRNKYGVCRDKAALMVTMLREAGISADIAMMNPFWKIDGDIPVDQFNHVIVSVSEPNGKREYIDPTIEKSNNYLASSEQDRAVLVCSKQGENLDWTALEDAQRNLYEIRAESKLTNEGRYESKVVIGSRGFPDLILRNYLQSMSKEEQTNTFRQIIQLFSSTAVLDSFRSSDLTDLSKQVKLHLQFHAQDYSVTAGKYVLFQMPNQAGGWDFLTQYFLQGAELTKRHYPLSIPSTFGVHAEERVSYPSGYRVRSMPVKVSINSNDYRLARNFESNANGLLVRRILEIKTLQIPVEKYESFQKMLKALSAMKRGQVVLEKQIVKEINMPQEPGNGRKR